MRKLAWIVAIVGQLALLSSSTSAQEYRGRVQGSIVDENKGALPGVSVTLRNDATGVAVTRTTNEARRSLPVIKRPRFSRKASLRSRQASALPNLHKQLMAELRNTIRADRTRRDIDREHAVHLAERPPWC